MVAGDAKLRSKRELIEKFINENLSNVPDSSSVTEYFGQFWSESYKTALGKICEEEQLVPEKVDKMIESYLFSEQAPIRDDAVALLKTKPKLLQRKKVGQRVLDKLMGLVKTFIHDAPE